MIILKIVLIKKDDGICVFLADVARVVLVWKIPFERVLGVKASINWIGDVFVFSEVLIEN